MLIIFDADVAGEPTDRFQPFVAPRGGCAVSGPVDRGLRADVGFVPQGGKAGEAVQQVFCICHLKTRGTAQDEVGGHGVLHGSTSGHGCEICFSKLKSALA